MIVATEYNKMAQLATKHTYQQPFSLVTKCKCGKIAGIMMIVDDNEGLLASQRPKGVKIWPHDVTAIALYICDHCGKITADWNQG